jgi:type I restriction enzyme S subunit
MELKPGYKQAEVGVIPEDWRLSKLSEVCTFENGDRGINYPSPCSFVPSGIPFVNAGHLQNGTISTREMDYITPRAFERLGSGKFVPGDILFCLRGSLGQYAIVDSSLRTGAIASSLVIVKTRQTLLSSEFLGLYFASRLCSQMIETWAGGAAQPNLGARDLGRFVIAIPPPHEQDKIACVLADIESNISTLSELIQKKRHIKLAAMQELLTGKRRLPGFEGEWELKRLGDVAHIKTGSKNNEDKVEDGEYPFFVRSDNVERIGSYSYDCEAVLVPGEGRIGDIFHYIKGRFDVHQRVYAITQFTQEVSGKFVHCYLAMNFGAWAMQNTVKATVDSLRLPTFQTFEMRLPPTKEEQDSIAGVLTEIDAELATLEARKVKVQMLKHGMMQQLLTGKIRLK